MRVISYTFPVFLFSQLWLNIEYLKRLAWRHCNWTGGSMVGWKLGNAFFGLTVICIFQSDVHQCERWDYVLEDK
jgi:hypothetical protein